MYLPGETLPNRKLKHKHVTTTDRISLNEISQFYTFSYEKHNFYHKCWIKKTLSFFVRNGLLKTQLLVNYLLKRSKFNMKFQNTIIWLKSRITSIGYSYFEKKTSGTVNSRILNTATCTHETHSFISIDETIRTNISM